MYTIHDYSVYQSQLAVGIEYDRSMPVMIKAIPVLTTSLINIEHKGRKGGGGWGGQLKPVQKGGRAWPASYKYKRFVQNSTAAYQEKGDIYEAKHNAK